MRFILTTGSLSNLDTLRGRYQNERSVNLNVKPSKIGIPTFMGSTDLNSRQTQISFLEKMHAILKKNLLNEEDIKSPEQWQANFTASRVMIAACLYVQSQIRWSKKNSALYRLIEDSLGITTQNYLDEEDKERCYLAANRMINSAKVDYEEANLILKKANLKPMPEQDWTAFSDFLHTKCTTLKANNIYTHYPFTSITQPLFGAAFSYSGASLGYLGGNTFSNSSSVMGTQYRLTALIGSTMLIMGPASPTSIAIFAPVIAGKLISSFCSISLAHVLGISMGLIGQGVGFGIGLPLDLAYNLIWKVCAAIRAHYLQDSNTPNLTGLRIADGAPFINGLVFEMTPEEELPDNCNVMEINEDGRVYLNNELIDLNQIEQIDIADIEGPIVDKQSLHANSIPHNDLLITQQGFQ